MKPRLAKALRLAFEIACAAGILALIVCVYYAPLSSWAVSRTAC